jgi:hypothetical protein
VHRIAHETAPDITPNSVIETDSDHVPLDLRDEWYIGT